LRVYDPTIFDDVGPGNRSIGKVYRRSSGGLYESGAVGEWGSGLDVFNGVVDYDTVPASEEPVVYFRVGNVASVSFGVNEIDLRLVGSFGANSRLPEVARGLKRLVVVPWEVSFDLCANWSKVGK
jgi:hypothetical protein